ncbi:MAG: type IV pilus biogenesis/stability protein PilW [Bacillota bacterium]
MNRFLRLAPFGALLFAACVSTPNTQFKSDMQRASQDNVALGIKYMQAGDRDTAMQKIQKAIQLDPDNANAYSAEALLYNTIGDADRADDAYHTALRKAPDDPQIENNYAVFLCQHGKTKDSVKYFLKAANNPMYTTPDAAYTNAGICAGRIPDPASAEEYFRKALGINPSFPEALYQMALVSYNQKKYLESRAFIERYNQVSQPRPEVLYLAVQTERALGNQQGAADYAKQLIKLFPASPQVQQLDQAVPNG